MIIDREIAPRSQTDTLIEAISSLWAAPWERCIADPETWPSTRDIAEHCNISIYKARYLLLKMASEGLVQVTPYPIRNGLRWHLCTVQSAEGAT